MRKKKSTKTDSLKKQVAEAMNGEEKPKKRRGRKSKDPAEIKEYYERKVVVFNPQSGLEHQVFSGVKPCQRVTETTQMGTRVLVARYPNFYRMYLYSFHKPGERSFPRGGVKVWNANFHQMQYFHTDSVAIHPEGGYHRFASVQEIDVDNLPIKDDNKGEPVSTE